jgi:hypothetical protein
VNKFYDEHVEMAMKTFYDNLNERDKRHYAAVATMQLPHGGKNYISSLLEIDTRTIYEGRVELEKNDIATEGIRRPGAGRKSIRDTYPNIDKIFLDILKNHTAGDPMNKKIIWTDLSKVEIVGLLEKEGITVSKVVVAQLLDKHGYVKRKIQKKKKIGDTEYRDEQFKNIAILKEKYQSTGNPVISVDGKKKEKLGELFREGSVYSKEEVQAFDHDYPHLSEGTVNMYSIFDVKKNEAFVSIGTSKETSLMACNTIKEWWLREGQDSYPKAVSILVLADAGGSNSSRHNIFKEDLSNLANEIGVEIRMAHYPPYTSKWNPIEHRVFPHITRSLSGLIIRSYEMVKYLIEKTVTKTGLKVKAFIDDIVYETGRKVSEDFNLNEFITFDEFLPRLNYVAMP